MPFLPSSGPLSINDIRNLFGGPSSPAMSNYYRGGAYIPATKTSTVTVREPTSGEYFDRNASAYNSVIVSNSGFTPNDPNGNTVYYWFKNLGTGGGIEVLPGVGNFPSVTFGGATYFRGSHRVFEYDSTYAVSTNWFGIYRTTTSTVTTNINTGVPSSGQISLSQFYGAEKP